MPCPPPLQPVLEEALRSGRHRHSHGALLPPASLEALFPPVPGPVPLPWAPGHDGWGSCRGLTGTSTAVSLPLPMLPALRRSTNRPFLARQRPAGPGGSAVSWLGVWPVQDVPDEFW